MRRFAIAALLVTTPAFAQAPVHQYGALALAPKGDRLASIEPVAPTHAAIVVRRVSDGGIVGEAAVDFIRQFKVDYAVIGASAIDEDGALLDFDFREVKVAQAIIANARHVILVCDSTKFERTAPVRIGHISQVDSFITDRCPDPRIRGICEESDVRLVEVAI